MNTLERDRHLVQRLLTGEDRAFEEFFDIYFPRLYRFALSRLSYDADAAEEVVQAALTKVISRLGSYRGEAALFTWLCTFCRREIGDWMRRRSRQPDPVGLMEDAPEIRAALESLTMVDEPGPEEKYRRRELSRAVQVTLDHLAPRYGDALEWKYIQGRSVKEIAARLEISPKAAESLLTRARIAFRDGFSEFAHELLGTSYEEATAR